MKRAFLVDTSVMDDLLNIPGKNQHHEEVYKKLLSHTEAGVTLILPAATVIEVGNHIAQIAGSQRFEFATKFSKLLLDAANGIPPWVFGPPFDMATLVRIANQLPEAAKQQIGGGDLSIIAAYERYIETTPSVSVGIWSLDAHLASFVREIPDVGLKPQKGRTKR